MGKIAFLFAGQGAQTPGMGQELCRISKAAAEVFAMADTLRPGTSAQCFEGTPEELALTQNTQPCVFTVDLAAAMALREAGVQPDMVAGFSLGELAALCFAGAIQPQDAFKLVCSRAQLMQQAAEKRPGAMAAVLRLQDEQVETLCRNYSSVWPVNYNCNGQLVVAAAADELPAFCEAAAAAGGTAKPLPVSGAFHSPFMADAATAFLQLLNEVKLSAPVIPVYANKLALPYEHPVAPVLAAQIESPVRWKQTIENMVRDGADTFIEVGPGKTLTGFNKRISKDVASYFVQDAASLENTLAALH